MGYNKLLQIININIFIISNVNIVITTSCYYSTITLTIIIIILSDLGGGRYWLAPSLTSIQLLIVALSSA